MDAGGDRYHKSSIFAHKSDRFFHRLLHPTNVAVIQEVYDGEFSQQYFQMELERALDAECEVIVIEPMQLGDETARWISVGNYLHKSAVVSGFGSIAAGNSSCTTILSAALIRLSCRFIVARKSFDMCAFRSIFFVVYWAVYCLMAVR